MSDADEIRTRRHRLGLTQDRLAEKAGVASNTLRNIERGRPSHHVSAVVQALDMLEDPQAPTSDDRDSRLRYLHHRLTVANRDPALAPIIDALGRALGADG